MADKGTDDLIGEKAPAKKPMPDAPVQTLSPRERAEARAAELRDHLGALDDMSDEFAIPKEIVPDGWTYEWKRRTNLGQEDYSYTVSLLQHGWEPVPVSRHPEMMPKDWAGGASIERKGMVLMERPTVIVEEAKKRSLRDARNQVRQKEAQLSGAPAGDNSPFEPTNKGSPLVNIKKSYEAIKIAEK
jgi:hypothetical protein